MEIKCQASAAADADSSSDHSEDNHSVDKAKIAAGPTVDINPGPKWHSGNSYVLPPGSGQTYKMVFWNGSEIGDDEAYSKVASIGASPNSRCHKMDTRRWLTLNTTTTAYVLMGVYGISSGGVMGWTAILNTSGAWYYRLKGSWERIRNENSRSVSVELPIGGGMTRPVWLYVKNPPQ
jgi:hypothetical protein